MPAVALRGEDLGTVANFLLAYAPDTLAAGGSPLEAGLVHRLDTGTSGVLLAARTAAAWRRRARAISPAGGGRSATWPGSTATSPAPASRREPIAHHPRRPQAMRACPDAEQARALRARPALTRYRPLERRGGATLLAIEITTGVRHQIRVHLAAAGHPVHGDTALRRLAARRA